jgi:uncharacterized protein (TIGR02145 family)
MKKRNNWIYPFILIVMLLILTYNCKKDDNGARSLTNVKTTAVFNSSKTYGTVTDIDGNEYKTITIGTQTWMAENLRTTKYRNGNPITEVTNNTSWSNLNTGGFCNYKNTQNNDTIATFGRLYNWFAVSDSRNIAPTGWHVSTDDEWTTLIDYLGGKSVAVGKLKETGTTHWTTPNTGADNSSGFTTLPGGNRYDDGTFKFIGNVGYWWSSNENDSYRAWLYSMNYNTSYLGRLYINKNFGCSVRCLRDN